MAGYKANVRQRTQHVPKTYQGHLVTPTRYYGAGSRGTMHGSIDGVLIRDSKGVPIRWRDI